VGNLPYSVSENEIDDFFSQCGGLDDIFLVKDRDTGDPKVREETDRLSLRDLCCIGPELFDFRR